MSLKAITLRMEENIYNKTKDIALQEKSSLNNFIYNLIVEKIKEKEKQELFDEFTIVGSDTDSDIEYSVVAQKEVIFNEKA
jgi:hypothetical protein